MASSNSLVSSRITSKAVDTFISEVTKNMPADADHKVRRKVKSDAWRVVCRKHPVTLEWRNDYNRHMTRCKGVRGIANTDEPMSDSAKLWKQIINTSGGSMKGVYAANGNTETVKPVVSTREVNGRNVTTVNRVTTLLEDWVLYNDLFPPVATLAHFTGLEVPLWHTALNRLESAGYIISPTEYGNIVTQRPLTVSKDEVSEYIKALPRQERITLLAELLGS